MCNSKKSKFLKEQEAKGALSNLLGKKVLILSKHTWVILLKDKKGITITSDFQKMLDESNRKSNKTWADKGSEFYNRSMKSLLQNNDMEMHSQHNEGKSVVVERFIRTLKNKTYKCLYCKLDDKYNNTYHNTVKMKPVDVKSSTYNDSIKENNNKDPKFKTGDIVRISKYKNKSKFSKTKLFRSKYKKRIGFI